MTFRGFSALKTKGVKLEMSRRKKRMMPSPIFICKQ
jgi:hypothetical protein